MKRTVRAAASALFAVGIALTSHRARAPEAAAAPRAVEFASVAAPRNIVLVTLDGVRWQELFGGVDPALAAQARLPWSAGGRARELLSGIRRLFFDAGTVIGDPRLPEGIFASGPRFVSLPAYVELMTGAISGCLDNACQPAIARTVADDIGWLPSIRHREDVAVFASWEVIGRAAAAPAGSRGAAPAGVIVDAGRGRTEAAPPWPGADGYRPDRATAAAAITHLLSHRPRFLWIALGDTDEWAHRGDYRGYLDALRFADRFIEELAAHLDELGAHGERTALLVTTDHGREDGFADHGAGRSDRVWLLARGAGLPRLGVIGTRRRRYLRDVAPTIQALMGLPRRGCAACGEAIDELFGR